MRNCKASGLPGWRWSDLQSEWVAGLESGLICKASGLPGWKVVWKTAKERVAGLEVVWKTAKERVAGLEVVWKTAKRVGCRAAEPNRAEWDSSAGTGPGPEGQVASAESCARVMK